MKKQMDKTGEAILKEDDEGNRWWETYDEGSKGPTGLAPGESIMFDPAGFPLGTKIQIWEPEESRKETKDEKANL